MKQNYYCSCHIMGGLGNKLFQIALILSYSKKYNYLPAITTINNNNQTIADWSYFIRNINIINNTNFIQINEPDYYPCVYFDLSNLPKNNLLFYGYFQTEKYFNKDLVYNQFKCPENVKKELINEFTDINNSIFLHIRRGDYINNPLHYIDLTNYYKKALEYFDNNTIIYIFSDEIEYCKNNLYDFLKNRKIKFIELNEVKSLWLMSLTGKGGICANSTFSWWGGWLNKKNNQNNKIIYPNKQFTTDLIKSNDLIPECFISLTP